MKFEDNSKNIEYLCVRKWMKYERNFYKYEIFNLLKNG